MFGIIKLLDPPFEKGELEPGYIKSYLPGVRENGGQYTHAAIWAIIAFAMFNFKDKAFECYKLINPILHSDTEDKAMLYKVEPFVIPADIYGSSNLLGRGGWTWYTGSSSWFYKAGIEYILGLKIEQGMLSVKPCIPSGIDEFFVRYEYKSSVYNIKVVNASKKVSGDFSSQEAISFKVNGEELSEKRLKLIDNGRIYEVEVVI